MLNSYLQLKNRQEWGLKIRARSVVNSATSRSGW